MDNADLHQFKLRVYVEDVDYMGIVHHPNYLCYFERARTEMMRQNNLILSDLIQSDILFAITKLNISYLAPARLDDELTVTTQMKKLGACRFLFEQEIKNQLEKIISKAQIKVVCVDSNLKPKRFPN